MRACLLVFLLFILTCFSPAQSFKVRISGTYDYHLTELSQDLHYERATIGEYYDDVFGINFDISWRLPGLNQNKGNFCFGFSYEKTKINSNSVKTDLALGKYIDQDKFTPYITFGGFINPADNIFLFGLFGVTFKSYLAEKGNLQYNYNSNPAIRIGCGIDFENIKDSPLTLGIAIYSDIGAVNVDRSIIPLYGQLYGRINHDGNIEFSDNILYLSVSAAYQINVY